MDAGLRTILLLVPSLLVVPEAQGREIVVELGWEDLRTVVDHTEFLSRTSVWTGTDGRHRARGRLVRISADGVTIARKRSLRLIGREDVHSMRLVPRKPGTTRNRTVAAILAAPIGVGTLMGMIMLTCATIDACMDTMESHELIGNLGVAVVVPYLVYRHARNADRGTIRFVLARSRKPEEQP